MLMDPSMRAVDHHNIAVANLDQRCQQLIILLSSGKTEEFEESSTSSSNGRRRVWER
jgi:hypothetical protein